MLSVTCTWEEGTQHRQEGLKKPLNRINGISSILTTSNSVCFEASLSSLKVLPKSAAGTLLELRLISESYVSIHSAAPLSPITSNTNEANAPLRPSLPSSVLSCCTCPTSLHHLPRCSYIGLGPECRSRWWFNANAAGPKCSEEKVEDKKVTETQAAKERRRHRDVSVMGEVYCDTLNESQIRATYCIVLSSTNLSCPLSAAEWRNILERVEKAMGLRAFCLFV